jgi:hypothetical protein
MITHQTLFAFLLLVVLATKTEAQDGHGVYWIRYQNQLLFSENISWSNEIDNRRFIDPDVQTQLIFHSRIHYKVGRWDYAGGLTLSNAFSAEPEKPISHPTTEVRPVIEASYDIPYKKWSLHQRVRIDNRFFEENKYEDIFDGTEYTMRIRYRVQARIPLLNKSSTSKISIRLAEEIMLNHRENTFDQNRIYLTGDFMINKKLSVEAGYIYIYQQRFGKEIFLERHVLRFSILQKIFLY